MTSEGSIALFFFLWFKNKRHGLCSIGHEGSVGVVGVVGGAVEAAAARHVAVAAAVAARVVHGPQKLDGRLCVEAADLRGVGREAAKALVLGLLCDAEALSALHAHRCGLWVRTRCCCCLRLLRNWRGLRVAGHDRNKRATVRHRVTEGEGGVKTRTSVAASEAQPLDGRVGAGTETAGKAAADLAAQPRDSLLALHRDQQSPSPKPHVHAHVPFLVSVLVLVKTSLVQQTDLDNEPDDVGVVSVFLGVFF